MVFFSAQGRLRRLFISCSLHPLTLWSAKAKYCWVLRLAGSLNDGKRWECDSRKPISSLNLDKVNLTRRYCSYTYSVVQTQGRWRLLASNQGLLFLQGAQETSPCFLWIRLIHPSDEGQRKARCAARHNPTPDIHLEQVCDGSIFLAQLTEMGFS